MEAASDVERGEQNSRNDYESERRPLAGSSSGDVRCGVLCQKRASTLQGVPVTNPAFAPLIDPRDLQSARAMRGGPHHSTGQQLTRAGWPSWSPWHSGCAMRVESRRVVAAVIGSRTLI
jgi:hypothetical protein